MRIPLVLTIALTACCVTMTEAQDRPQQTGLKLTLHEIPRHDIYQLQESVVLSFEIDNAGSEPIGVYARLGIGYQGGIILHVLDASGHEVAPPILEHDFLDTDSIEDPNNYFELLPGHFWGIRQSFRIGELILKPGSYRLLAEYHCPVDSRSTKIPHFWGIDRESVISNEIPVLIK